MPISSVPASQIDPALAALAVVEQADTDMLAALLDGDLSTRSLAKLAADPAVHVRDGCFRLAPETAARILATLEQGSRSLYRLLHRRAVAHLAARLRSGDGDVEPVFLAVFERLANRLLDDDPDGLVQLMDAMQDLPLADAAGRQRCRYFEGAALFTSERYGEALTVFNGLLADPALTPRYRARTLNTRAVCLYLTGRLEDALAGYRDSLERWRQLGDRQSEAKVLLNMGITAYDLQNYDEAQDQLHRAAASFDDIGSTTWSAVARNELGLVYRDQGKWTEALACFRRFVEQRQTEDAWDDVGRGLNNIGEILLFQGHTSDAVAVFREALEKMTTRVYRIDTHLNLGLAHQANGDLAQARVAFQEALNLSQTIGRRDILPHVHYRLADVLHRLGADAAAMEQLRAGVEVIEATRAPLRDEGLKISLLGRWQQVYEAMVLHNLEQGQVADAFNYVERARSRAFLDMLAQVDEPASGRAVGTGYPPTSDYARDPLDVATEPPLTAGEVQARLPDGYALVEYFATGSAGRSEALLASLPPQSQHLRDSLVLPGRLFAFVVTRENLHGLALQADMRRIAAQHFNRSDGRLRGITPLPGQPLRPLQRWRDLHRQLIRPLKPYLAGKQHVFLVPHGILHYLSLHALAGDAPAVGRPDVTYSYAPSASVLFTAGLDRPPRSRMGDCLAVGVDAGDLAHAEAEADWLARQLSGTVLLGRAATPDAVRQALAAHRVIHFSCHGLFRRSDPMDSCLVLSGGELSAADILRDVTLDADLVTLSACDTGLNRLTPGDELLGLTRAFLGAGARSLLVTLWPVHEVPTRLFMEHFYRSWTGGVARAAALVQAQRYVRTMDVATLRARLVDYGLSAPEVEKLIGLFRQMVPGERPFDHPYYWGAFLLVGDPR